VLVAAYIDGRVEFGEQVEPLPVSRRIPRDKIAEVEAAVAGRPGVEVYHYEAGRPSQADRESNPRDPAGPQVDMTRSAYRAAGGEYGNRTETPATGRAAVSR